MSCVSFNPSYPSSLPPSCPSNSAYPTPCRRHWRRQARVHDEYPRRFLKTIREHQLTQTLQRPVDTHHGSYSLPHNSTSHLFTVGFFASLPQLSPDPTSSSQGTSTYTPQLDSQSAFEPTHASSFNHITFTGSVPSSTPSAVPTSSTSAVTEEHFKVPAPPVRSYHRRGSLPFGCDSPRLSRPSLEAASQLSFAARQKRAAFAAGSPLTPKDIEMSLLPSFESEGIKRSPAFPNVDRELDLNSFMRFDDIEEDMLSPYKSTPLGTPSAPNSLPLSFTPSEASHSNEFDLFSSPLFDSVPTTYEPSPAFGYEPSPFDSVDASPLFALLDDSALAAEPSSSTTFADVGGLDSLCGPSPAHFAHAFKKTATGSGLPAIVSRSPSQESEAGVSLEQLMSTSPPTNANDSPAFAGFAPVTASPSLPAFTPLSVNETPAVAVVSQPETSTSAGRRIRTMPTGTRNTSIPPIAPDAPPRPKSYVAPSATSRKLIPAKRLADAMAAADTTASGSDSPPVAKRGRGRPKKVTGDEGVLLAAAASVMEGSAPSDISEELMEKIEADRKRNRDAARMSRARKEAAMQGLRDQVSALESALKEEREKSARMEEMVRMMRQGK